MKICNFCGAETNVDRIKIRGVKRFCACQSCQKRLTNALNKSDEEYEKYVCLLEDDFSVPRDLLNLLYIIPSLKKTKKKNVKIKKSYFLKYLNSYPKSRLVFSSVAETFFFVSVNTLIGVLLFDLLKVQLDAKVLTLWTLSSLLSSFLVGVLCLNTGVTKIPCSKTWKFMSNVNKWLLNGFNKVGKIKTGKNFLNFFLLPLFVKLPLCIIGAVVLMLSSILSLLLVALVAVLHALFLFAPAYYIDYKRRKN